MLAGKAVGIWGRPDVDRKAGVAGVSGRATVVAATSAEDHMDCKIYSALS